MASCSQGAHVLTNKHGQDRLCWLTQNRAENRTDTQRSKARETEPMSLVTRTHLALEIGHRELPNRVCRGHVCSYHLDRGN
jgi:hypothetical protein